MNTKEPKISVIVPVYNSANFVDKCAQSLINQSLQEIEIIFVDDASTDNSLEILKKYEQEYPEKIVVIHSKINQRQGGARNLALEVAKGEYIGFVDADDWVETDMFELMYNKAKATNSDLCYCTCRKIFENGKQKIYYPSYSFPIGIITEEKRREMIINHITLIPCNIYKRSIFTENNIRFPTMLRYEDMLIEPLVIPSLKQISSINIPLYNYFVRSNSTTTENNDTKYKDKILVCQMIVEEYKKRSLYEKYINEVNYLYFRKGYIHVALNYIINSKRIQKDVFITLKKNLLKIDNNYRKNPYYKSNKTFLLIDKLLDNYLSVRLLKIALKITKYNI